LRFPEAAHFANPFVDLLDHARIEKAVMNAPFFLPHHQAGPLQHPQVLRDCRQRHVERLGQLGDRPVAAGQPGQDGAAGGVGDGEECGVQAG
jgi:hypothetical protein